MTSAERFSNAPITEAVLELRVRLSQEVDVARLATFQETLKEEYPLKRERRSWETGFQFKSEHPPEIVGQSVKPMGYLLTSADGKQVVKARLDAFALSRLKPYDCWGTFRDEARTLWKRYVEIASPETITKVSLRYINRIEIPLPLKDFKEYILTI